MEGSEASIVRDAAWQPTLGPNSTTFRMVHLLFFAFEGKKALLAHLARKTGGAPGRGATESDRLEVSFRLRDLCRADTSLRTGAVS